MKQFFNAVTEAAKELTKKARAWLIAAASALAGELPYKFDPATAADVTYNVQIMHNGGADVAAVCLLVLEKIDIRLVKHVFQNRFSSFCRSPGFSECAYRPDYPLLTVAGAELVGHDLTLYVMYADNVAAAHYLDGLRDRRRKAKEQEVQKHNAKRLTEEDFL